MWIIDIAVIKSKIMKKILFSLSFLAVVSICSAQLVTPFVLTNSANTDNFMRFIPKGTIVNGSNYVTGFLTLSDYKNVTTDNWIEAGTPFQKLQLRGGNVLLYQSPENFNPTSRNGAILFSDIVNSYFSDGKWGIEYDNQYSTGGLNIFNPVSEINPARRNFNLFISNEGLIGIGTGQPSAKLEITDGDIFINDISRGIIMKSPDGNCWRGTLNNEGQLVFTVLEDCASVAVKETTTDLNFKIYPNPANGYIEISIPEIKSTCVATIFSIKGELLKSVNITDQLSRIDISGLKSGSYLIKVMSANQVGTETLVIK